MKNGTLSRLRRCDIYNSNEFTVWLNGEIETTDYETDENDEVESFNEKFWTNVPKIRHICL